MWKFLHIACMFGATSFAVGIGVFRNALLRSRDVATIRRATAMERRLGDWVGGSLFIAGVVFGFVTALTRGFDLTAPWLVTAYVLVAAMLVNGLAFYDPHARRLRSAAEASPVDRPSPELEALLDSSRTWTLSVIDAILWLALVYTMVLKPFT